MRFENRVNELCNSVLQYDNIDSYLVAIEQALCLEVPRQTNRFGYPQGQDYWNWGLCLIRDFLSNRVVAYQEACDRFESLKEHHYETNTDDFVIYPNPSVDEVHIKMLDGRSRATEFLLCDVSGRVLLNGTCYLSACQELVLGSELRPGVYVVKIGPYVHKFVKL